MEVSVNALRQRNIMYVQTVRGSIYETGLPYHPHLTILQYGRRPRGPPLQTRTWNNSNKSDLCLRLRPFIHSWHLL